MSSPPYTHPGHRAPSPRPISPWRPGPGGASGPTTTAAPPPGTGAGDGGEQGPESGSGLPQDSGWAWMYVLGSFLVQLLVIGGARSYGVLHVEFVEKFGGEERAASWLPQALNGLITMALGPVAASLGRRYTYRALVMVGGLFLSVGYVTSAYAASTPALCFCYGLIVGTGNGLCLAPSITVISQYFERRRALANIIVVAGGAVGCLLLPPLYRHLVDSHGLRGALIINASLALHVCLGGALMRPAELYRRRPRTRAGEEEEEETIVLNGRHKQVHYSLPAKEPTSNLTLPEDHSGERYKERVLYRGISEMTLAPLEDSPVNPPIPQGRAEMQGRLRRWFYQWLCYRALTGRGRALYDWSLLRDPLFHVSLWPILLATVGFPSMFLILPPSAVQAGLSKDQAALLVSVLGLADLLGRVASAWVVDLGLLCKRTAFALALALGGAVCLVLPGVQGRLAGLLVLCVLLGLCGGGYIALVAARLAEALGHDRLPGALGLNVLGQGCVSFLSFPFLGFWYSMTSGWSASYYTCAVCILTGAVCTRLEPLAARYRSVEHHRRSLVTAPSESQEVIIQRITQL